MTPPLIPAQYVWSDAQGIGRTTVTLFRRSFILNQLPEPTDAILHLFADSAYRVRINGVILGYGPARFVPAFPEYDSYDLTPFLHQGENVIAVEVCHYGVSTFQTMPGTTAGFSAWGTVGEVQLATPGEWRCLHTDAWDTQAPPFSFAQGPVEILDLNQLPSGWCESGFADNAWSAPTLLADQQCWGPLQPRSIAYNDAATALVSQWNIALIAPIEEREERLVCAVAAPEFHGNYKQEWSFCYSVCLYSPRAQDVELGLFWGPNYLNGERLREEDDGRHGNRRIAYARMQEGWNILFGAVGMHQDVWGVLIGLPRDAGLIARSEPDLQARGLFRSSPPISEAERRAQHYPIPVTFADVLAFPFPWIEATREQMAHLPAREMAWDGISRPAPPTQTSFPIVLDCRKQRTHTLVLDWRGEYLGHVVVDLEAPAGTYLDMGYDERQRADGLLDLFKTNPFTNTADRFLCREGRQTIEGLRVRGGRYLQLTLRAQPGTTQIVIHEVALRPATYPFAIEGSFACSDPLFNWSWQTALATMQACAEDAYLDCPWRERGLYTGDCYVEARAQQAFSSDPRLIRRCIQLWAQGIREDGLTTAAIPAWHRLPHGDFTMIWLLLLHEYWCWSGDRAFLEQMWPTVERIWQSSAWSTSSSELWDASELNLFIDWGAPKEARTADENGVLNAFRYRALLCCAELANVLARPDLADTYASQAHHIRTVFQRRLWSHEHGFFVAGTHDGKPGDAVSIHTNVLVLAFGLATTEQEPTVLRYVEEWLAHNVEKGLAQQKGFVDLYFLVYAIDALYRYDRVQQAEDLVRLHYGLLQDHGAWTFWESFVSGAQGLNSLCHAWSSAPMIMAQQSILGVRLERVGDTTTFVIAPRAATLTWARGVVPHPAGSIEVEWSIKGERLQMRVRVPGGVHITVRPEGPLRMYPLDLDCQMCHNEEQSVGKLS